MRNVLNKYSVRTPVKHRKTAVYSRNRTVASQDFVSMAFLRYGAYPYSAVFCTAVAVYGTVVSPNSETSAYLLRTNYCCRDSPHKPHAQESLERSDALSSVVPCYTYVSLFACRPYVAQTNTSRFGCTVFPQIERGHRHSRTSSYEPTRALEIFQPWLRTSPMPIL